MRRMKLGQKWRDRKKQREYKISGSLWSPSRLLVFGICLPGFGALGFQSSFHESLWREGRPLGIFLLLPASLSTYECFPQIRCGGGEITWRATKPLCVRVEFWPENAHNLERTGTWFIDWQILKAGPAQMCQMWLQENNTYKTHESNNLLF